MFNNNKGGYGRNFEVVAERIKLAQDDLIRKQSLIKDTTPTTSTPLSMEADKKPKEPPLYPTDIMPGVKVENPTFNQVASIDVNKTVTEAPQNPEAARGAHEAAVGTYQKMDQAIKAEFMAELKEVDRGVHDAMESLMTPGGSGSTAWEAVNLGNPFADLGEVVSLLMKQPDNQRFLAALDTTLSNLQTRTDQQNEMAAKGKGPAPKIDWNKFETPKQLQAFMERDVSKDPFMQQAADNEQIVERMEDNFDKYEKVYAQGRSEKITTDMQVAALESGNEALLKAMVKDDAKVQQIKATGKIEPKDAAPIVANEAEEVRMFAAAGREIIGVKALKVDISDISEGARGAAKSAYEIPPPKLAPLFDGPSASSHA